MSQENVEIVERAWNAYIAGDLDALFEQFDPDITWDTTHFEGWPEESIVSGHAGVRQFFRQWLATWERYEAGVDEYIDAGEQGVLVLCWQRGYGRGSHVPVRMDWAQVSTVRNGLVWQMKAYSDQQAAREAVGVRASTA